jgi:hypothetical protein
VNSQGRGIRPIRLVEHALGGSNLSNPDQVSCRRGCLVEHLQGQLAERRRSLRIGRRAARRRWGLAVLLLVVLAFVGLTARAVRVAGIGDARAGRRGGGLRGRTWRTATRLIMEGVAPTLVIFQRLGSRLDRREPAVPRLVGGDRAVPHP